jgi:DNA mismatch repair ATPase MutS
MFDVNEILARLQNGDSAEDLAAEMSKALNAAEAKFQEAKEKAVAEAKALEKEAKLNDLAETILLAIDEYISIRCPEAMDTEGVDMEVAEFRELLDELLDSIVKMRELFGDIAVPAFKVSKTEPKAPKKLKRADDKIADFLKTMGW